MDKTPQRRWPRRPEQLVPEILLLWLPRGTEYTLQRPSGEAVLQELNEPLLIGCCVFLATSNQNHCLGGSVGILQRVLNGYFAYHVVPTNLLRLNGFRRGRSAAHGGMQFCCAGSSTTPDSTGLVSIAWTCGVRPVAGSASLSEERFFHVRPCGQEPAAGMRLGIAGSVRGGQYGRPYRDPSIEGQIVQHAGVTPVLSAV